jgi:hypothetical protein
MKDIIYLLFDLLNALAKLLRPGWKPSCDRRKLALEATTHHPQQVSSKIARSDYPRSHCSWLPNPVFESQAYSQISNSHQAIYPALFPPCLEETKVSSALLIRRRQEGRAKGTIKGNHTR